MKQIIVSLFLIKFPNISKFGFYLKENLDDYIINDSLILWGITFYIRQQYHLAAPGRFGIRKPLLFVFC